MKPLRVALSCVVVAVLAGLFIGCATNPVTGRREISLVSPSQELSIGKEGYPAVVSEYGLYDDTRLAAYVDSVGQRLAKASHLPNLEWHFTVLDDPTVNAFAMPGGYIYVTRGIIAHLNSEAQLAGVLGHEIGHVTHRHTAERLTQQSLVGLGLGIASAVSGTFGRYSGAAQQALGIVFLKYSRDDENEADQLGVEYSVAAGYDAREMPATYVMLRRVGEQAGQRMPAFLSTHPDPGDRENRTRELAKTATAGKTGLVVRSRDYVRRLDGMVFGDDPRQGYFEGTRFVQPELGFQITFPSGWKTQNSHSAVAAQAPDQSGVMQLTLVQAPGLAPADYVAQLVRDRKIAGAEGGRETIGGFPAWVGHIGLIRQDGTTATIAAAFIRKSEQLFQVLGQAASDESAIFSSMRSFGAVGPEARASAVPSRIRVVTVGTSGPFSTVLASLGPQALGFEPTSILNNVETDETVAAGTLLKIVVKPAR
jgi:predicted Zn-dependent protease